jgi:hypothetical protein
MSQTFPSVAQSEVTLSFDDPNWSGKDLRWLPHFESVFGLFDALSNDRLHIDLSIRGLSVLRARIAVSADDPYVRWMSNALGYLNRARRLASKLDVSLTYVAAYPFTREQHIELDDAVETFDGISQEEDPHVVSVVTQVDDACIRQLTDPSTPHLMQLRQQSGGSLNVYGQPVKLPPVQIALENVFAEILKIDEVQGDEKRLEIAWKPLKGFRCIRSFLALGTDVPDASRP